MSNLHPVYQFDGEQWCIVARGELGDYLTIVRVSGAFATRKVKRQEFFKTAKKEETWN